MIPNIPVAPARPAWPIAAAAAAFALIQIIDSALKVPFPGSTALFVFLGGTAIFLILSLPSSGLNRQVAAVAAGSWVAAIVLIVLINQEFLIPMLKGNYRNPIGMFLPVAVHFAGACVFGFLLRTARTTVPWSSILVVATIWAGMRLFEGALFTVAGLAGSSAIILVLALISAIEGGTVVWLARQ